MTTEINDRLDTLEQGFVCEHQGLRILDDGPLSFSKWKFIGKSIVTSLHEAKSAKYWQLGDWMLLARGEWGDTYKLAMEVTGYSYKHVGKIVKTASLFPPSKRVSGLYWSHHRYVVHLPEAQRIETLMQAKRNQWSARQTHDYAVKLNDEHRTPEERQQVRRRPSPTVKCPQCQHEFSIRGNKVENK
jgi:hypothetical protein